MWPSGCCTSGGYRGGCRRNWRQAACKPAVGKRRRTRRKETGGPSNAQTDSFKLSEFVPVARSARPGAFLGGTVGGGVVCELRHAPVGSPSRRSGIFFPVGISHAGRPLVFRAGMQLLPRLVR